MGSLISKEEMAALAETVEDVYGDRTEVEIYHQTEADEETSWDDSVEAPIEDDATPAAVVNGWFRNQPDYQTTDALAALAHEEDGRLFLPLGTELSRTDKVVVFPMDDEGNRIGNGTAYRVIDTNFENTFKVLVRVSLKRLA